MSSNESRPRRRHLKTAVAATVFVAVAGSLLGLRVTQAQKDQPKKDEKAPALVFTAADIARVETRSLERSISISGSLSPVVQSTVRSKVPGEVREILVREGDRVGRGEVMARIDTADLQARLDAQAAALEEARARYDIADKNRANNQQLLRQKFISQIAFDTAQSTYEAAAATVRSAEAQVRIAKKAMDDAVVRAPIAGIVSRKMVTTGEKVGIDAALFAVVDLSRMEIEAPAPAAEIPAVKPGQLALLEVGGFADRVFEGRVERINPTTQEGSRSIVLYLSIANPDGALKGGMFASGRLVIDRRPPAPVVPITAVREEAGQAYVFVIEGGRIAKRSVTVGARDPRGGWVEIVKGIENGAPVVRTRITDLKPGAPAVLKDGEPAAPKAA